MRGSSNGTPVYSTDTGRIKPVTVNKPASHQGDGIVRLRREVKGRAGGTVIVISGIMLAGGDLRELAGALKKRCGCGGTAKGGVIEIQGDHRDALMIELQERGYKVKLAGG